MHVAVVVAVVGAADEGEKKDTVVVLLMVFYSDAEVEGQNRGCCRRQYDVVVGGEGGVDGERRYWWEFGSGLGYCYY